MEKRNPTQHRMTRRSAVHDYTRPGIYHITLHVADGLGQVLGLVMGSLTAPDDTPDAPRTELSVIGQMVERELLHSISAHYPMVIVDSYIIMPEHLHFIMVVQDRIISCNGKIQTIGQVLAGFKKGCNKRYWEMVGNNGGEANRSGETAAHTAPTAVHTAPTAAHTAQAAAHTAPTAVHTVPTAAHTAPTAVHTAQAAAHTAPTAAHTAQAAAHTAPTAAHTAQAAVHTAPTAAHTAPTAVHTAQAAVHTVPGGFPAGYKSPSNASSGRPPLFAPGYCDVMPVDAAHLATQRQYIKENPRSRLQRMNNRPQLSVCRRSINTAVTPSALRGYLLRECLPKQATPEVLAAIEGHLLLMPTAATAPSGSAARLGVPRFILCDSFGDRSLLQRRCLPVVCHYKERALFEQQKARCLKEAARGAVLVSACISLRENDIITESVNHGYPVITIHDNGFPDRYHPSAERQELCAAGCLLLVSPWTYQYRGKNEQINVPFCKTMNCVAQAICQKKDSWWKEQKE